MRTILFYALAILFWHPGLAQPFSRDKEISVSILNNAVAMPFSGKAGIIHSPMHPGFTVGYAKPVNKKIKHQLRFGYKVGYIFQHRVQHAIQLYPELGYRYTTRSGIGADARLGLGYMHSFPDLQQFKLNAKGEYERYGRAGKPSAFASFSLGAGYDMQKSFSMPVYFYFQYQLWFQSPYVRSYVPVLPNAALHVGAAYYLKN